MRRWRAGEIVTVPEPVLRERAREVTPAQLASPEVQRLIDDMIETMRAASGAGLAANQVGELLRIAVIEVAGRNQRYPYKPPIALTVIVNPVIEPLDDERFAINEGCLSVPDTPRRRRAPRQRPRALPRPRRRRARRRAPRPDRGHLPARARPPRRRAVPRPRRRSRDADDVGRSSSASTAPRSRREPASSSRASAHDRAVVRARLARRRRAATAGVLIELDGDGRIASVRAGAAPPARRRAPARPDDPRARQRALARLPARAARPRPGAGLVLDLARADVSRSPRRSIPTGCLRARASDVRRDGAGRRDGRRRVSLPAPRARRRAVRRSRTRWAARCSPPPPRPGSGSSCSTPATCTAAARGFATRAPRRGPSACRQLDGAPGAAIHSVRAVDPAAARVVAALGGGASARRCTRTSPSSRPRTRAPRGGPRR